MPTLGRPPVLLDVVEEHFDELDWMCEHREANIFTSDWTLIDLAEHEARAEAHADALRLSELHGVDLALDRIAGGEPFAATAAAFVLLDTGVDEFRQAVWEAFRTAPIEAVAGIRLALRHRSVSDGADVLRALTQHEDPNRAVAAADVLAFHGIAADGVEVWLADEDPGVCAQGFCVAGRTSGVSSADLERGLASSEGHVRWAALEAAARAATPATLDRCKAHAGAPEASPEAIAFLGILGGPEDVAILQALTANPESGVHAVRALGALGRVEAIPFLLDLMSDDTLGVLATAAYRRITGAGDVEGERPFPLPEVPEGEDEEEALPPDPGRAREDWQQRASQMTPAARWQQGHPFTDDTPRGMTKLTLESRRDGYLRLRSRLGAAMPALELEASARRQAAELGAAFGGGA